MIRAISVKFLFIVFLLIHVISLGILNCQKAFAEDAFPAFLDLNNQLFSKIPGVRLIGLNPEIYELKSGEANYYHKTIGILPPKNTSQQVARRTKDKIIFNVKYEIDEFSRRKPLSPNPHRQAIAMAGCSFTFGDGINAEDTFQEKFNSIPENKYFAYNHGIPGGSANISLEYLKETDLKKVYPSGADFVFVHWQELIERTAGTWPTAIWMLETPHFSKNSAGKLERDGSLGEARWFRKFLGLAIQKVIPASYLENKPYPILFKSDFDYYCDILGEMRDEWVRKLPGSKFFVYIHPNNNSGNDFISSCAKEKSFSYISPTPIKLPPEEKNIPLDGHPNGKFNAHIANDLFKALNTK